MKSMSFFKYLFFLAVAIVLIPACGDDPIGGGGTSGTTGPSVSLLADTDVLSQDTTLASGQSFTVRLNAISGESNLNSLKVLEDGFNLSTDRYAIVGISTTNNPQLIPDADQISFIWDITLTAQTENTAVLYEFEVTDVDGNVSAASILVSTAITAGDVFITYNGPATVETTPESLNNYSFNIDANGNTLSTIGVYEDGVLLDASRLRYNSDPFTANPEAFADADVNGFDGNIGVRANAGVHTLTFEVTTAAGTTFTQDVNYTSEAPGTALSGEYSAKIVYNASGPLFGGLDLDSGNVVSANDVNADIIDSGIDTSGPTVVWNQTIEPANGADLRILGSTMETFTYDSVVSKEAIQAAYDGGSSVSVSGTVEVGDLFTVNTNGTTYLLVVRDVKITTGDNEDSYTFDVKY